MPPPFAAVYFDCDSTLSAIEGVDELLEIAAPELRATIAALTREAMDGTRPLADVYEQRLAMLAPRRDQLENVGTLYVARLVEHAREVVQALRFLGKHVGIISGGLLVPVQHVAHHLGIEPTNVHAVPLRFDAHGNYLDFERRSPLWKNRGKVEVVQNLPRAHRPMAFVGDGVTDLETQGTVELFVGFGGVVARPAVRDGAEAFVGGPSLAPLLRFVLTEGELATLAAQPHFAPLLSAAEA